MRNLTTTKIIERFRDEDGSISVLTIGLFFVTITLLILITNVASISVSKQSLVNATESAAIHASHNVDLESYYRGNTSVTVPIDCEAAYRKVIEELNLWMQSDGHIRRQELEQVWLTDFTCAENRVQLSTSARAILPFRLPQSSQFVEIHATVEAQSDRAR